MRYATIFLLQKHDRALSLSEIANELNYSAEDQLARLTRFVKKSTEEGYLQESNAKYSTTPAIQTLGIACVN